MRHHIIFDNSGSMAEYGKSFLLVNLLRYMRQVISQNNKQCQFYSLSEQLREISWADNKQDITLPAYGKSLVMESLLALLGESNNDKVLFLTDGYIDITPTQAHDLQQYSNLIIVALGADAHHSNLERIKCPVFVAADIRAALDVLFSPIVASVPPFSSTQLKAHDEVECDDE